MSYGVWNQGKSHLLWAVLGCSHWTLWSNFNVFIYAIPVLDLSLAPFSLPAFSTNTFWTLTTPILLQLCSWLLCLAVLLHSPNSWFVFLFCWISRLKLPTCSTFSILSTLCIQEWAWFRSLTLSSVRLLNHAHSWQYS